MNFESLNPLIVDDGQTGNKLLASIEINPIKQSVVHIREHEFALDVKEMDSQNGRVSIAIREKNNGVPNSRSRRNVDKNTGYKQILDAILEHAENDERPYLAILRLFDIQYIFRPEGLGILKESNCTLDETKITWCTVANGQKAESIRTMQLPIRL